MSDIKDDLTPEEAIALLPEGENIHTFRSGGGLMLGADWSRAGVLEAIRNSPSRRPAGPAASAMGHGLAFMHRGDWLFVETVKEAQS